MIAKQSIGKSFTGALNYNLKKTQNSNPKERAELLTTNFASMDTTSIRKELAIMKALNPKLKRNTYHTSLNFAIGEKIDNRKMQQVAEEYLKKMGFDNNLHIIFRHHDSNHPHCHILALRNRFDGTVVTDSNNYKRSEQVIRELESKYNLQKVKSSKQSKLKAPNKDELEMIQRTGKPSRKLILQEKVKDALKYSASMQDFIHNLEAQNINVLFNQASTGRVSGITYQVPGFKIRGQALGNQFKFGSITKQINYEQSRDGQAIHQANSRTRQRFGERTKTRLAKSIPVNGIPYSKQWYDYATSRGFHKVSSIPFGINNPGQKGAFRFDQRNESFEKGSKEDTSHMDHKLSYDRSTHLSLLGGLAGVLDIQVDNSPVEKQSKKRKIGIGR
jgi:hypothetical protein